MDKLIPTTFFHETYQGVDVYFENVLPGELAWRVRDSRLTPEIRTIIFNK